MMTIIWLILGVYNDIKQKDLDPQVQAGWIIGFMCTLMIDALGIVITCKLFPVIELCGCK